MKSGNFEFLKTKLPELEALGAFAEKYVYPDPDSCAVKLRQFAERLVKITNIELGIIPEPNATLYDMLIEPQFQKTIPRTVLSKLHYLRVSGNTGAHSTDGISSDDALNLLREAFDVGRWIYLSYFGGKHTDATMFSPPDRPTNGWKKERSKILEQLNSKEAEISQLLKELEKTREQVATFEKSKSELQSILKRGQTVANQLDFDEATTRKLLIDEQLAKAGWKIGKGTQPTHEVTQEVEIEHQPTESGIGFADYVLWDDDGKPLAVIEAKRTSIDPGLGRKQASLYADGLEKMYGDRPIIFYTNGFEIYILNDLQNESPRKIYGFYSKESLQYLHFQRKERIPASKILPDPHIAGRIYQMEAIKRVVERFGDNKRKALIVLATGTGKTRVAISICEALLRARWVRRILFLCDRKELRKQAKNTFIEFIPEEPLTIVRANTAKDLDKRIYLATYPAMIQYYKNFDVGFFDLIIADESHRSIYNAYRDLFYYFDTLQIGLTATPVNFINRNTFKLFDCDSLDPTASYSYEDAINDNPQYLVPFRVTTHSTQFRREGIKYADLTDAQKLELEDQIANADLVNYEDKDVDKKIINKDSNRAILNNLMKNGIRETTGMHVGKTIIFARNHEHAKVLESLFYEMYAQYGGDFCQVIDNYDPRAEQLIDDFKGKGNNPNLTIAISVDMLDTGIDIPEVVNLVFAKPVKSFVKFWQMIGRGTRLCENLFGPGRDKTKFQIFDHWNNFEEFDINIVEEKPSRNKSLMEQLFETRVTLADFALQKFDQEAFKLVVELIEKDLATLENTDTIAVRDQWRVIQELSRQGVIQSFSKDTKYRLLNEIVPLMQWRNIYGQFDAYSFDLLIANLQLSHLRGTQTFQNFKDDLFNRISRLTKNLDEVKVKSDVINNVRSGKFWENLTTQSLEDIRLELRGIMKYHQRGNNRENSPLIVDITEAKEKIQTDIYRPKIKSMELATYRERVIEVLQELFDKNETLQKIKHGDPVNTADLDALVSLVLSQHPDVDLQLLRDIYPETTGQLDYAIRRLLGLEKDFVDAHFINFVQTHPELTATQIQFLNMLKNHICKYGAIQLEKLYDHPFSLLSNEGINGVFQDPGQLEELIEIIDTINSPA
ncbi:MAG: DEAD/DEAH box helicase family protein [Calditrichaeota bacterium]|nr:DEAD/DEAH box helicase family protein [Calditrichota bacterium]